MKYDQFVSIILCNLKISLRIIRTLSIFDKIYQYNILYIMNIASKKSKTRSCLQPHRQPSSTLCNDPLKYVIIDSENEEQLINIRSYESVFQVDPFGMPQEKKSVILKSKGSKMANFLSNQIDPQRVFDKDILAAEAEVERLKKECDLIQTMISDMIEQQARIQVSLRKFERRQSISKEYQAQEKQKFYSNYQTKAQTQASSEVRQTLQSKLWSINYKTPICVTTPINSQVVEKLKKKSLQIVKTVDFSSKKSKQIKENITPHKKIKTINSISRLKTNHKSTQKMSRKKSKAL